MSSIQGNDILEVLNEVQRHVVTATEEPVLEIAGAGTMKCCLQMNKDFSHTLLQLVR